MTTTQRPVASHGFQHEALLYDGPDGFLEGTVPFITAGVEAGEPVLVVVAATKIQALRSALDGAADHVLFADMADVGLNPARIIPAWRQFLDANGGGEQRVRGIGEPIWAGRGEFELIEAQRHEALLNVAFAGSGDWMLLCPYDRTTLDRSVLDEAERTHPVIQHRGRRRASRHCRDLDAMAAPFDAVMREPHAPVAEVGFTGEEELAPVRAFVNRQAELAGLNDQRAAALVLAANEVASNSVRYGGGGGVLRVWSEGEMVICEVRDRGRLDKPLAGRERPGLLELGGRGLWIANQVCDLVQLRTYADGNAVRIHLRIR